MGWSDLEVNKLPADEVAEQRGKLEAEREALQKTLRSLLSTDEAKPVVRWLRQIAAAGSYAPGRPFEQVAHHEGVRALAARILHLGGQTQ